jgi:UDP-2,3-diacylglucosamine pyrophosphatase LpxH
LSETKQSIIVVADTHFGLRKETQVCDPNAFSDFLNWIKHLERGGKEKLDLGIWGSSEKSVVLEPPEKIILLGDILELWDASAKSIDASTRYVIQLLSDLNCEKIYVLGNHDYDLLDIAGDYPLGASKISITDKEVTISKGTEEYLFLHGQQFDKLFALPSWQFMSPIRNAASAFGSYTWIFVILFAADLIFETIGGFKGIADIVLFTLLGAISIPFLIIKFGRDVWNKLKTTKYKPRDAEKNVENWWNTFPKRKEQKSRNWNIVYGHTHIIDFWRKADGENPLTLWNIPSWVRDSTKTSKVNLEQVFRHAFLYIYDEGCEFVGWDTKKKKPFLIPKDVILEKRESGDLTKLEIYEIEDNLREIGWPQELINKWMQYSPI